MISIYLFWYIKKYNGLALIGGVAIWSKATAWVAVAAISIDLLIKKQYKQALIHGLLIAVLALPYYGRNVVVFHNPFATSVDFPQYTIHQEPGYRDVPFFVSLNHFFQLDIYHAHWNELIAGTYFSWFWDGQNVLLPIQSISWPTKIMVLFSLPIAFMSIYGCIKLWSEKKYRVMVIYTALLVGSYIAYTIKLPFYSTVKAAFICSLIPIFGLSLKTAFQSNQPLQRVSAVYVYGWCLGILYMFAIRPGWY
jgi:hypothetical protein